MKTIGMIGGTTWVSTSDYYRLINQEVNKLLGGLNSAKLILYSVNFQEAYDFYSRKDFEGQKNLLLDAVKRLVNAGVDGLILCANTLHKYADPITEIIRIPLIHIAEETAKAILEKGLSNVALLGTATTMQETFYTDILKSFGITTMVPSPEDQVFINDIIFSELAKDIFKDSTRKRLLEIMDRLSEGGAQGMILGCTELPLIIKPEHTSLALFDTLHIHAEAAARFVAEK